MEVVFPRVWPAKEIGKMMAGTSECKGQGHRVDVKEERERGTW
jgi:hypothetical protein